MNRSQNWTDCLKISTTSTRSCTSVTLELLQSFLVFLTGLKSISPSHPTVSEITRPANTVSVVSLFSMFLCDVFTVHCVFTFYFVCYLADLATIKYTYIHAHIHTCRDVKMQSPVIIIFNIITITSIINGCTTATGR